MNETKERNGAKVPPRTYGIIQVPGIACELSLLVGWGRAAAASPPRPGSITAMTISSRQKPTEEVAFSPNDQRVFPTTRSNRHNHIR